MYIHTVPTVFQCFNCIRARFGLLIIWFGLLKKKVQTWYHLKKNVQADLLKVCSTKEDCIFEANKTRNAHRAPWHNEYGIRDFPAWLSKIMGEENANKKFYHMHHNLLNLEVIVVIVTRYIKLEG